MNEVVNADYRVEQPRTLPVIASEILQIERNVCNVAMDGAIEIGKRLQEAKEKVGYGEWENWCKENLNYSGRQAERFMKIATEYGNENSIYSKTTTWSELSVSKALRLLQVPEEEVENFVENHDIEDMTVKELEAEIKQLKQEKQNADAAAEKAMSELNQATAKLSQAEQDTLKLRKLLDEEQAKEQTPANSEELENLKTLLAKAEAAQLKAEDELKKSEAQFNLLAENAEQDAKEQQEKEAKAKAEGIEEGKQQAADEAARLKDENDALQRKLSAVQDPNKIRMAGMVDAIQKTFDSCIELVAAMNDEDRDKAKNALNVVLDGMKGKLQ